ncbi:endo-1,3-alpha-glucanase family glycosylhydrolase [Nonomuraea sp. NPDC050663]|uniref:endo-1,3-alpha-glucanase family glycosylhydrolase n=1 Tax=Nonomuraea sp. NPDC050663 TaxID=3364370 RepID=UPI0037A7EF6A
MTTRITGYFRTAVATLGTLAVLGAHLATPATAATPAPGLQAAATAEGAVATGQGAAARGAVAAPVTLTVPATKDVFLSQGEPAKNFGAAEWLTVCGSACTSSIAGRRMALVGFDLTGLPAGAVITSATIDVVSIRTSATTVTAHRVTGDWSEATTWNTRPAVGEATAGTRTGFTASQPAQLTVTSAITGNGSYGFALVQDDAAVTQLHSSEATGERGPKLTVTYTEGATTGPLPFVLPAKGELRASDKKVFAHYFTPYPISLDNKDPASDYYARNYLSPTGESGKHAAYGGLLRDRPLPRPPITSGDYVAENLKTEVRQAIAAGIDGFTVDILSVTTSNAHWVRVNKLIQAAEAVDPGFDIVLMPDMNGLASQSSDAIADAMALLAKSDSVLRLGDGRLVISPFKAEARTATWWRDWIAAMNTEHGLKIALVPVFLNFGTNKDAFAPISYGFSNWGSRNPAANSSLGANIATAHGLGKIWMQPVSVQDERPNQAKYDEAANTQNLRTTWAGAIDGDADWVQLTTWNDYSENTQFAPSRNAGWTYLDINAYYLTCYKLGCPRITKDVAYVTHRVQPHAAAPTYTGQTSLMTLRSGSTAARDTVEVLTMLTASSTVSVTVGTAKHTYTAPAGVSAKTFTLVPGDVSATVTRSGTVASVASPYPVTAKPYVQDLHYRAASSAR